MKMQKKKLVAAMALAAAVASPAAFATNGILQAGNGMVAHGMGGAGLANASEASSGMDNPALISHTGDAVNIAWSMFMPLREMDGTAYGGNKVTSDANEYAIPQASFTKKTSDRISWGVMAYALGGMNTDYPTGLFGGNPETVNLQGLIVAPEISVAFSKDISLGIAALIGRETLRTRNLFGQGAAGTGEDTEIGYGAKLGVNWNITKGIAVAATYQPKMSFGELDYFKNLITNFGFTGDAALTLPDQAGIGAKFGVGSNVDIVADIMYYKWSGVDVFEFFGWDDQVVYKLGAEFRPTDAWALRVGYNYGKSPIQGGNRVPSLGGGMDAAFANYPFPAISENHFTLGLGYKLAKNTSLNAYYLYSPETTQEATTTSVTSGGPVPPGTKITMSQSAFGLGVNIGF